MPLCAKCHKVVSYLYSHGMCSACWIRLSDEQRNILQGKIAPPQTCTRCKTRLRPDARHCQNCGHPTDPKAARKRRITPDTVMLILLTALFAFILIRWLFI
jgi:predicted amidophosphoribosyltransferase